MSIAAPPIPSASDQALLRRFAATRDPALRETLIERFLPLARSVARRYASGHEPLEDLEQVAALGLVKAVDRYDPAVGTRFSTYAVPTILGELRRHFRDHGWMVRVSRRLQELTLRIRSEAESFEQRHGRPATLAELAAILDVSEEMVMEAHALGTARAPVSLDAPVAGPEAVSLGELLGDDDPGVNRVDELQTARALIRELPLRSRRALGMRFLEDLTQAEIAQRMGVSQMQVSRILRDALDRLHARIASVSVPAGAPARARG
jgi:RNA polymerase sigma-B factor